MILTNIEYDVSNLFESDDAIAICEIDGDGLKNLAFLVCEAGWGLIVIETALGHHVLIARADGTHESNLFSDTRRWSRQHGYQFDLKHSVERVSTARENFLVLTDGRKFEIRSVYTAAIGFTHGGLSGLDRLPEGYVRL